MKAMCTLWPKNQGLPLKSSKSDFCKIHVCTYEYNDQKTENIVESLSDVTHPEGKSSRAMTKESTTPLPAKLNWFEVTKSKDEYPPQWWTFVVEQQMQRYSAQWWQEFSFSHGGWSFLRHYKRTSYATTRVVPSMDECRSESLVQQGQRPVLFEDRFLE